MTNTSASMLAYSKAPTGINLASFEAEYPSIFHAEIVSNRALSVTARGGNVPRPMSATHAVITGTEDSLVEFIQKYRRTSIELPTTVANLAAQIETVLEKATPGEVEFRGWHLPYIDMHTVEDLCLLAADFAGETGLTPEQLDMVVTTLACKVSVVRCQHVFMAKPDGLPSRSLHAAHMAYYKGLLEQYETRLLTRMPLSSAFEHQATPDKYDPITGWASPTFHGNLTGWQQHQQLFILPATFRHTTPLVYQPSAIEGILANG